MLPNKRKKKRELKNKKKTQQKKKKKKGGQELKEAKHEEDLIGVSAKYITHKRRFLYH